MVAAAGYQATLVRSEESGPLAGTVGEVPAAAASDNAERATARSVVAEGSARRLAERRQILFERRAEWDVPDAAPLASDASGAQPIITDDGLAERVQERWKQESEDPDSVSRHRRNILDSFRRAGGGALVTAIECRETLCRVRMDRVVLEYDDMRKFGASRLAAAITIVEGGAEAGEIVGILPIDFAEVDAGK